MNGVSIGSDNGLPPIQRQAIIETNSGLLQWDFNQNIKLFIIENASENIVCEMAAVFKLGGGGGGVSYGIPALVQIMALCRAGDYLNQ